MTGLQIKTVICLLPNVKMTSPLGFTELPTIYIMVLVKCNILRPNMVIYVYSGLLAVLKIDLPKKGIKEMYAFWSLFLILISDYLNLLS